MGTQTVVNSTDFALYLGASGSETQIAHTTDASISISHSPREITSKDSAGWQEFLEGIRGATGSASFFFIGDASAAYSLHDFYTQCITNRTTIHAIYQTSDSADITFEGDVYLSSVEISSPAAEDNVTVSISFTFTGAIAVANT